jgi:hypothetical protein
MKNPAWFWTDERIPEESRPAVVATLRMLRESKRLAVSNNHDTWSLAVELHYLLAGGSNITILRWLVLERLIEHKKEMTRPEANQRRFQSSDSLRFGPRSCFVLSDKGLAFVVSTGATLETILGQNGSVIMKGNGKSNGGKAKPHWDRKTRKLSVDAVLVKHFQVPAANQEQVLLAFQQQKWRRCVPNPLPS